ncbi:unnamed protein product [Darwinula stevensoni]|uniref:ZZ-type domain-containing protein n=1 Tax=Darwinula stevensoni TaxID=69355 RepID=A0A7R9AB55_9CRUS|nr:unnamed protein product [Darwinula stevensoni]CAG0899056.1 unnamed protein product [Darwinula stevensoni]
MRDVHTDVRCDSCRGPVRGSRYKCLQCRDFNLCSTCEASGTKHSQHSFIRLPSRMSDVRLTPDLDGIIGAIHPGVTCSSCSNGVKGGRFKCLVCPQYDLCSKCEQSRELHFHHPMIRFAKPSSIAFTLANVLPDGVFCSECGGKIVEYRYKCLKCQDFDLCMTCEAASKHLQHRMLRIPSKPEIGGTNEDWEKTRRKSENSSAKRTTPRQGESPRIILKERSIEMENAHRTKPLESELHQLREQQLAELHEMKNAAIEEEAKMRSLEHDQRMAILTAIYDRIVNASL